MHQGANDPSVTISTIKFSNDTILDLASDETILIVGPNNSGKSATLRAIQSKLESASATSPVVSAIEIKKNGSIQILWDWIEALAKYVPDNVIDPAFMLMGHKLYKSQINYWWQATPQEIGGLSKWFCHFITADERLRICVPPKQISLTKSGPTHPIHYLQRDDNLELELSDIFRKAFGLDLIVHRNAGSHVPLHIGPRPKPENGDDRVSTRYIEKLELLPTLESQGDGMRSFAGVLLAASVGIENIMLIDEPEAFLHPPQAKLLGKFLSNKLSRERQLFVATHSVDILRGVLDSAEHKFKIIRIQRKGDQNDIRLLDNTRIREIWADPLLRYSNILDGLFHEGVVVCESDGDCRFYSAMVDAVTESSAFAPRPPDILFTHCGGKARLAIVVQALREIGVPVKAIADFDILSNEQPLRGVVEALGGTWSDIESNWRTVKSAIDSQRPEMHTTDIRAEINKVLDSVTTLNLPEKPRLELQRILKRSTAWSNVKLVGKAFVPSGEPTRQCDYLMSQLQNIGLHVVPVGELEGFCRSVGDHGPRWVNSVLVKNLANDEELSPAREFAKNLLKFR